MGRATKYFAILLICIAGLLLFGCTMQSDSESLKDFEELKIRFEMQKGFSPNLITMNDYLIELSALRAKSVGSAGKILDAEISSAQAYFYLASALNASNAIDYLSPKCSSKEVKTTQDFVFLSIKSANDAITKLSALSAQELSNLRENQLEAAKGYKERALEISDYLNQIC